MYLFVYLSNPNPQIVYVCLCVCVCVCVPLRSWGAPEFGICQGSTASSHFIENTSLSLFKCIGQGRICFDVLDEYHQFSEGLTIRTWTITFSLQHWQPFCFFQFQFLSFLQTKLQKEKIKPGVVGLISKNQIHWLYLIKALVASLCPFVGTTTYIN